MDSTTKARPLQVRARTAEVVEHHFSTANPDKPLRLLVPGAIIALAALGLILSVVYQAWYTKTMPVNRAIPFILLLAPVYTGGVFIFSYGYELYDLGAALKLTLAVVAITVLAVVMVAALLALLSGSKGGSKSSGSSKSGKSSGGRSGKSFDMNLGGHGGWVSSGTGSPPATAGPIAPVPPPLVPPAGMPPALACPACGQSFFMGSRTLFCPSCGGSLPAELLSALRPPQGPV